MTEPHEIALDALQRLRQEEGVDTTFPSDKIWGFATADVESRRRPAAITHLRRAGYLVPTGKTTRSVTPRRAGSPTTEYGFGPAFGGSPAGESPPVPLESELASEF